MRVGIDFDNTIVCYDALFHRVCRERGLIPASVPVNKSEVRNYLRQVGREEDWTEMQGCVYGARMSEAEPFPQVMDFLRDALASGHGVSIISHKTRRPFRGEQHDLHAAARAWLESQGFFNPSILGLAREQVFFEETKGEKLARIGSEGCALFIDDLPELLNEPSFPGGVRKVLFDPNDLYPDAAEWRRIRSWSEARATVL